MDRLQNAVARNEINEAIALADQLRHLAEDPSAPKGEKDSPNLMYREIFDATIHDYFRVDSLPTVLSFWTLVATLLVGIGTVIVGIAAIFD